MSPDVAAHADDAPRDGDIRDLDGHPQIYRQPPGHWVDIVPRIPPMTAPPAPLSQA